MEGNDRTQVAKGMELKIGKWTDTHYGGVGGVMGRSWGRYSPGGPGFQLMGSGYLLPLPKGQPIFSQPLPPPGIILQLVM